MTNAPDAIPAGMRFQGMVRALSQWENMDPKAVLDGSRAQAEYALIDAKHDIAVLAHHLADRTSRSPLAAPVAEVRARYSGEDDFGERDVSWLVKPSDLPSGTKLYSAIPAPGTALSGTAEGWKPIETAPNGKSILLHYDDGEIVILEERDNDDEWLPYPGKQRFCSRPTHWMPLPAAPTPPSADSAQDVGDLEASVKRLPHITLSDPEDAYGVSDKAYVELSEVLSIIKRSSTDGKS